MNPSLNPVPRENCTWRQYSKRWIKYNHLQTSSFAVQSSFFAKSSNASRFHWPTSHRVSSQHALDESLCEQTSDVVQLSLYMIAVHLMLLPPKQELWLTIGLERTIAARRLEEPQGERIVRPIISCVQIGFFSNVLQTGTLGSDQTTSL